ncbi:major facilitator superfamily domain-containing protein [Usnea florida]
MAKWMMGRGARKFVFLGRSGIDKPSARRIVEDLISNRAQCEVVRGDVCYMRDVQSLVNRVDGLIGGVIQAAMGLNTPTDIEKQNPKQTQESNLVTWDSLNDPENPTGWSFKRKLFVSGVLVSLPLIVNVGTSILRAAGVFIAKEYHVGSEVTVLTTSLFLMGFTFGPLIFGPLSEKIGRRLLIILGVIMFSTFCLPVALAQNIWTIMISRFFSGAFGSSAMAVTGGALTDVWPTAVSRGIAIDVFNATGFIGPVIGPIAGNFITYSSLGWRWTMWITAIFAYTSGIFAFFALPETYAPVLLTAKAARLRHETKNWAIHSKLDEDRTDLALLYGMLFLFFEGFPISFVQDRHWSPRLSSLTFVALAIGVIFGLISVVTHALTIFARQSASTPGKIIPERRLPPMIIDAIILPVGLFWFAWTSHPGTSWVAQVIAAIPISGSMFVIFIQGLKYIIDVLSALWYGHVSQTGYRLGYEPARVLVHCPGPGPDRFLYLWTKGLGLCHARA